MCQNLKYEVSGCFHDVRVALQHLGAAAPAQRLWSGPLCGPGFLFCQSLIALEDVVGGRSKESFIGRETKTG